MENKKFTKKDFQLGHIAIFKNEPHMVMCDSENCMALVNDKHHWIALHMFDDDLCFASPLTGKLEPITEVYGYSKWHYNALELSTRTRKLLWKREDPVKKMTVEEIEKELGYKVEIVS